MTQDFWEDLYQAVLRYLLRTIQLKIIFVKVPPYQECSDAMQKYYVEFSTHIDSKTNSTKIYQSIQFVFKVKFQGTLNL